MDTLVPSSTESTASSVSSTESSSTRRIRWGHVYYRPYARTIAACGIPEDITYSLSLSNSIVLYDTKGNITGGYDPFLRQPVPIHTETGEIGLPSLTNIPSSINSIPSGHENFSSSSPLSAESAPLVLPPFSSSLSTVTSDNPGTTTTHLTTNDSTHTSHNLALSPLESTALTLSNTVSGNGMNISSSSSTSISLSSSILPIPTTNATDTLPSTDPSLFSTTNSLNSPIHSTAVVSNDINMMIMDNTNSENSEGLSSTSSSSSTISNSKSTNSTHPPFSPSQTHSSSSDSTSSSSLTSLSSPSSISSLSSPSRTNQPNSSTVIDTSIASSSIASSVHSFSQDSSFSSDDLSFLFSTPTLNAALIPRNPPPRPLISGEVYGGTLDEFDEEMTKKKEAREASTAPLSFLQRKRGRHAFNVSSIPPPLPWFGLNAKQRATRISTGVLSSPYASLVTLNSEISDELRVIIASRKKSNTGCRCSLLASTELQPLPIKALRTECELRNLASTGNKTVLIARLIEHSQNNLGCIRKASLPTVTLSKYLEPYGPHPTKAQRNQAKRKTKEELQYLKLHNFRPETSTVSMPTNVTNENTGTVIVTENSQSGGDTSNILASNPSSMNDIDDEESINTETFLNDTDDSNDEEDANNVAGDTEARLLKAYKTAVKLAENLAAEATKEQLSSSTVATSTTVIATPPPNPPVAEHSLTMETALHIQSTPVVHQGPPPGTLIPALDICPCAASGEGCHFNRCLCDPTLCDNRMCGDPGASSYDDVGIFLHRELIRTLQSMVQNYFYTPEVIREWRAKQMLAMSRQVVMNDDDEEDDDDHHHDQDAMDLLFGDHNEYLDEHLMENNTNDDTNDQSTNGSASLPSSGDDNHLEHLDTESDIDGGRMVGDELATTGEEFAREATSKLFALLNANNSGDNDDEEDDENNTNEEEEEQQQDKGSVLSSASSQLSHLGHRVSSSLVMDHGTSTTAPVEETILDGPHDPVSTLLAHHIHDHHAHPHHEKHKGTHPSVSNDDENEDKECSSPSRKRIAREE